MIRKIKNCLKKQPANPNESLLSKEYEEVAKKGDEEPETKAAECSVPTLTEKLADEAVKATQEEMEASNEQTEALKTCEEQNVVPQAADVPIKEIPVVKAAEDAEQPPASTDTAIELHKQVEPLRLEEAEQAPMISEEITMVKEVSIVPTSHGSVFKTETVQHETHQMITADSVAVQNKDTVNEEIVSISKKEIEVTTPTSFKSRN